MDLSLKTRYEAFVLKNEGLVRKLQEVANVLVFLVPGNSLDGELAQEGGLAAINLFVMYHTILFDRKRTQEQALRTGRKNGLFAAREAVRASRCDQSLNGDGVDTADANHNGSNSSSRAGAVGHDGGEAISHSDIAKGRELAEQRGTNNNMQGNSSSHNKETTRGVLPRSTLRLALTLCAHTEVVAEMIAIRMVGEGRKWPLINLIEGLKALCRLVLLGTAKDSHSSRSHAFPRKFAGEAKEKYTSRQPQVQHHGGQYPSSKEPASGVTGSGIGGFPGSTGSMRPLQDKAGPDEPSVVLRQTMDHRHRERQCWTFKHNDNDACTTVDPTPVHVSSVDRGKHRSQRHGAGIVVFGKRIIPHDVVKLGEVLHILRPFVYSALRWKAWRRPWTAFFTSIVFDLTSSCCVDAAAVIEVCQGEGFGNHGNPTLREALVQVVFGRQLWVASTVLFGHKIPSRSYDESLEAALLKLFSLHDRQEFARRRSLWLYYMLRDPLFERTTRPILSAMAGWVGRVPLVGGLAEFAMFSLLYYQKKYFWFAGSSSR